MLRIFSGRLVYCRGAISHDRGTPARVRMQLREGTHALIPNTLTPTPQDPPVSALDNKGFGCVYSGLDCHICAKLVRQRFVDALFAGEYSPTPLRPYARNPPKIPDHQPQSKSNIRPDETMGVTRTSNSRLWVSGLCIRVWGVGCNVSGAGFRDSGFGFVAAPAPLAGDCSRGSGLGLGVWGSGFRGSCFVFQMSGLGFGFQV